MRDRSFACVVRALLLATALSCGIACGGSPNQVEAPTGTPPTTTSAPAPSSTSPTPPNATTTSGATMSADTARKGRAWVDAEAKRGDMLEAQSRTGLVSSTQVAAASRDWMHACRESGMRGDELAAAAQKHLDRMNRSLDLTKARYKAAGVTEADVAAAEAAVAEAEFVLSMAKDAR